MNTAILEIPLEEDLGTVSCEGNVPAGEVMTLCGQPAVSRVLFSCPCGHSPRFFICGGHLDNLRTGNYWCPVCRLTRGTFTEC